MLKQCSINGKTKPQTFWRWKSKVDRRAWEYSQGVGHSIISRISVHDIPDNEMVKSGYWSKTSCSSLGCGCRVPKWFTVKKFKAKTLKNRSVKTVTLEYENYPNK